MLTNTKAYSGIAVKMLVDQRMSAALGTMFMVDYQPGAVALRRLDERQPVVAGRPSPAA